MAPRSATSATARSRPRWAASAAARRHLDRRRHLRHPRRKRLPSRAGRTVRTIVLCG
jgi:hypothetical protein